MVTMLLTSMFRNVSPAVHEIEPRPQGKQVAFIPTASAVEPWGSVHTVLSKRTLQRLGFEVEQLDVESLPSDSAEAVTRKITEADCIYVGGGNTFFLLQELRRTGADEVIINQVHAGMPYIGESAGSVITAPDIGYIKLMDRTDKAPDLTNYAGLGLTDFHVVPHQHAATMGRAAQRILDRYGTNPGFKPLTNHQALLITNDSLTTLTA